MSAMKKDPQKEARILDAAMKIFAEKGLEKGTIQDIAGGAGIGKGTVYQYFSSKDEIFRALLSGFFAEMVREWQALVEMEMHPAEKLRMIVESAFAMLEDFEDPKLKATFPVLLEIMLYGFREKMKGERHFDLAAVIRPLFEVIEPLMKEGIVKGVFRPADPGSLSFILFSFLDGLGMHYYLQHDRLDLHQMRDETVEFILRAIIKDL